ncbi:MAG: guanylate kinase, partial [Fimbriimonadaceae bacterium]|nr:guanylate kinase [Chitinophagales bacterium]
EVYPQRFYGTLKTELGRIWNQGSHIIFDVDVKGAYNLQHMYPENSLSIFIKPPSEDILIERLKKRKTETPESLAIRLERVKMELAWEDKFDHVLVNDILENTLEQAYKIVSGFITVV